MLRYITPNGNLKTIAGNLKGGFSGDGGPATQAGMGMQNRTGLALDAAGNLYVADGFNHRVRVIAPNGIISTFAGGGRSNSVGDGGLAQNAGFSVPRGLLFDSHGNLLISDVAANRIREVLAAPPADHGGAQPNELFSAGRWRAHTAATDHHRWSGKRRRIHHYSEHRCGLAGGERRWFYSAISQRASGSVESRRGRLSTPPSPSPRRWLLPRPASCR